MPKPLRVVLVLALVATAGTLIWYFGLRTPPEPAGVIAVSGRIEGDDAIVSAKVGGRLREVSVREGDAVTAGQVIAVLDDDQVSARVAQAKSGVDAAAARLDRARRQIGVLEEQLAQSRIGVDQARLDAQGRVDQARAQIAAAEATLAQAEANWQQAVWDAERFETLAKEGHEPERIAKQTRSQATALEAAVRAARRQVEAARGALEAATASLKNPAVRTSQASAIEQQIAQARTDVTAFDSELARARALVEEAEATRGDLSVRAPFDGTVATRAAEPGEVLAPGTPIVTIVNLGDVYMRGFIPEGDIGRVKIGQAARVYLDSSPSTPIEAEVTRIDPQASFTPENTYFRDDRVKQVFGVKLRVRGAEGFAKPGMPADGQILVEGDTWPAAPGTR